MRSLPSEMAAFHAQIIEKERDTLWEWGVVPRGHLHVIDNGVP